DLAGLRARHRQYPAHSRGHRRPALRGAGAGRRAVAPRLACPPGRLEQAQHDFDPTKTRSPRPAGLRSEMDSVSEDYGVAQAAAGPARYEPVVSVRGLVKRYRGHEAVAGIDLEVRRGEIFAFLGPNGAGKTTTVEILEGFQQRTAGQVCVLGQDPATAGGAWRGRGGVGSQGAGAQPRLSGRECPALEARVYRAPRGGRR